MEKFSQHLVAGERIQHGFIEVLQELRGVQILGLHHFEESEATSDDPSTVGAQADMIARCRTFCYTDVTCTHWQFGADGCWIEHYGEKGDFPPTGVSYNSTWALSQVIGEVLKHTCPGYVPPEEPPTPWVWIITGVVLCLLALSAILYLVVKPKPVVKRTRAIKLGPSTQEGPEESEPLFIPDKVQAPLFIPQPTALVPQSSLVAVAVPGSQPLVAPQLPGRILPDLTGTALIR